MNVFGDYSHYYNMLYKDKDYRAEAEYVNKLICRYSSSAFSLLDLGCGTGSYSREFVRMGYRVQGVDLSPQMLAEAQKYAADTLSFICGDVRTLRLSSRFDVVTALFHVLSYQNEDEDVVSTLKTVREHLTPNGVFVLDFWYGPAVLTQRPEVRFKEAADSRIEVSRIALPSIHPDRNVVDVNYRTFVRDKKSGGIEEIRECHSMRYFFDKELKQFLEQAGLTPERMNGWMTETPANTNSWAAVIVGRAS